PKHDGQDLAQGNVTVVRALVVAPAQVNAQPVPRQVTGGVVEGLDVSGCDLQELRRAEVGEGQVASHGEIGAVDLEHEARGGDRVVFLFHDVGKPRQVRGARRVVLVAEEVRDDAG